MTTNTTTAEDDLAKLGIKLPAPPEPFGTYVAAVQTGNRVSEAGSFVRESMGRPIDTWIYAESGLTCFGRALTYSFYLVQGREEGMG